MKPIFDSGFFGGKITAMANNPDFNVSHCEISRHESTGDLLSGDARRVVIPIVGALIITLKGDLMSDKVIALTPFTSYEIPKMCKYSMRASDFSSANFMLIESAKPEVSK